MIQLMKNDNNDDFNNDNNNETFWVGAMIEFCTL